MASPSHGLSDPGLGHLLRSDKFSGVVSVILHGRERLSYTSGLANHETGCAVTRDTRFPTASVSKMFTALCVARLVESGLCGFDQPIIEILPSLEPNFDSKVTIGALLSHRSGLGDYIDDDAVLPFDGLDVFELDRLQAFLPLVLNVGFHESASFRYSSAGYVLLGLAIEKLTGLPFPQAMAHWVTTPAGLTATGFPRNDAAQDDLAVGYLADGSNNLSHLPIVGGPDGGIVTNAPDLQVLFECLRTNRLINRETLEFLVQPVSSINERLSYGYGFYVLHDHNQTWYGHTGSDPGLSARVAFSLSSDASIIVLCNCDNLAFPVFRAVVDWLGDHDRLARL